ncbi:MAG: nicotinamide riboside transporter PnuC [Pseudomonadota bacterium]|uniref:nicotinamide riboside transporter PnuC n=1 Tax=Pseudoalteromonas phenolica TaxID=161398 RepID=UPI000C0A9343|nr:nicotinamide mononucleotide transporter [Pseudoalteromonas sp.]
MEFLSATFSGFTAMSGWEYIAVLLSLAYVLLAVKESQWCWPAAFISTFIYTVMYWNGALLMESALNVYYMIMAVIGWRMWQQGQLKVVAPIVSWSLSRHMLIIGATTLISIIMGFVMDNYTHAELAYLDSFTTCFAVMTTYLVAKKVLENWLYWIIIDAASMYLYFVKGYYPTFVLFIFYTFMACWGYKRWYEEHEQRNGQPLASL